MRNPFERGTNQTARSENLQFTSTFDRPNYLAIAYGLGMPEAQAPKVIPHHKPISRGIAEIDGERTKIQLQIDYPVVKAEQIANSLVDRTEKGWRPPNPNEVLDGIYGSRDSIDKQTDQVLKAAQNYKFPSSDLFTGFIDTSLDHFHKRLGEINTNHFPLFLLDPRVAIVLESYRNRESRISRLTEIIAENLALYIIVHELQHAAIRPEVSSIKFENFRWQNFERPVLIALIGVGTAALCSALISPQMMPALATSLNPEGLPLFAKSILTKRAALMQRRLYLQTLEESLVIRATEDHMIQRFYSRRNYPYPFKFTAQPNPPNKKVGL